MASNDGLMRGVANVRQLIATYLEAEMPFFLAQARVQWGRAEWELPTPRVYDAYDPLTVDKWPAIGSVTLSSSRWGVNDSSIGFQEDKFWPSYNLRVFLWCRTPQKPDGTWQQPPYDTALQCRDDLVAVMRATLLNDPSLGTSEDGNVQFNPASLNEQYFDAMKQQDGARWMAGGSIALDLAVGERITFVDIPGVYEAYGEVETHETEIEKVPIGEFLDREEYPEDYVEPVH